MLAEMAALPSGIPQGNGKQKYCGGAVPGASTKQKHLLYEALGVSEKVW